MKYSSVNACQPAHPASRWMQSIFLAIAMVGSAAAHADQHEQVVKTEQILQEAGFQKQPATTPEAVANLESLTQQKLVHHLVDGKHHYTYADAVVCQCLYLGRELQYQKYLKLASNPELATLRQEALESGEEVDESVDWNHWGPFSP